MRRDVRIGQILELMGAVDHNAAEIARSYADAHGIAIGEAFVRRLGVPAEAVAKALQIQSEAASGDCGDAACDMVQSANEARTGLVCKLREAVSDVRDYGWKPVRTVHRSARRQEGETPRSNQADSDSSQHGST